MSRRPSRRARAAVLALLAVPVLGGCATDTGSPATAPVAAASPLATASAAASGAKAAKAAKNAKKAARTPQVLTTSGPGTDEEPAAMALPGPPVRPVPPVGTRRPPKLPPSEGRRDDCAPLYGPGTTVALEAATTGGRLVVSWRHNADPATLRYRVGVQPVEWVRGQGETRLTRPEIVWADVAPPPGCEPATYTVPGARRGVEYRVWLEVDVRTTVGDPTRMSVGRLTGVTLG